MGGMENGNQDKHDHLPQWPPLRRGAVWELPPGGAPDPFGVPTTLGGSLSAPGQGDPVVGWLVFIGLCGPQFSWSQEGGGHA